MRNILNINYKWAFSKESAEVPASVPAKWNFVNLPHSWNAIDGQDGGNDYYRGTAYYAKELDKEEIPVADKYYLELKGANSSADLYVNGEKKMHHDGGYSTWRCDITDEIAKGPRTMIVVAVHNAANETVYPQMADFTFYGGLYRDVNLICVSSSHFDLEHHGGPGLKITPTVAGNDADVEVQVWVKAYKTNQKLRYILRNADGKVISTYDTTARKVKFPIKNVHKWHGRRDPYLYSCEVQLMEGEEILDNVSSRFGCRSFEIHPEKGFLLNGEEYPLRGVSRHQDRWGFGNALLPEHHREDMEYICEVGATTIRLAHYQHDQYFYDLCDEYGQVIWAEIPYISKHLPGGRENTISQMKELVVQNYNHPSIVVWGLSNEISIGGSDEDLLENHRILNDLCHEMDKTRLTTIAAVSMCKLEDPYLQIPDVVSYNHYFGWYGGDTSMNGPWFDKFHATHPNIPIGISEYGCEALNWHTSNPMQGDYTEEYQAYYHEELIKQINERPYLWATHVWNMYDFGADARAEGGENGQNHKGLMTFDRKYKKDSFFAYKAWLNPEPMVHICGKRYVDRVEDVTKVTVYSNQPTVELFANGESLGVQEHNGLPFFYFDVPNAGTTQLVAKAGALTDESVINKVAVFNEAYRLQEKGAILNWFDIDAPEGYLSLNDKMSDVLATVQGKLLFASLMGKMLGGKKGDKKGEKKQVMGFDVTPEMMSMMGGFTVLRLITMAGGMMDAKFTKEQLLDLNAKLNKIKKADK